MEKIIDYKSELKQLLTNILERGTKELSKAQNNLVTNEKSQIATNQQELTQACKQFYFNREKEIEHEKIMALLNFKWVSMLD
jgi:hypothetical protein